MTKNTGLRFNTGKNRLSLVPYELIEEVGKVMTYGANKYTIKKSNKTISGDNNWRGGMKWSTVLDSLKRHILAFEKGENTDEESGLPHLSHAATNIAFLLTYFHTHPQNDDRIIDNRLCPKNKKTKK